MRYSSVSLVLEWSVGKFHCTGSTEILYREDVVPIIFCVFIKLFPKDFAIK